MESEKTHAFMLNLRFVHSTKIYWLWQKLQSVQLNGNYWLTNCDPFWLHFTIFQSSIHCTTIYYYSIFMTNFSLIDNHFNSQYISNKYTFKLVKCAYVCSLWFYVLLFQTCAKVFQKFIFRAQRERQRDGESTYQDSNIFIMHSFFFSRTYISHDSLSGGDRLSNLKASNSNKWMHEINYELMIFVCQTLKMNMEI